jgi:SAM-dependent methyltransferase
VEPLDRRQKILAGIDLKNTVGVEIGALDKPIVTRDDGNIIYVDHTDRESLKEKYQMEPAVVQDNIVVVDAIWGAQTLQEAIGKEQKVDYVIASHVIEHVPDLISWLQELRCVLKPNGEIRLAVPDRRFTFDYLRRETTLADIFNAYLARARSPLAISVLDYVLNSAPVNPVEAWAGRLKIASLKPTLSIESALGLARKIYDTGAYLDVHCWVFTPKSFANLFAQAAEADLIHFECHKFYDTPQNDIEFIVALKASRDKVRITESWQSMARLVKDHERHCPSSAAVEARLLLSQIDAIKASTSWRITAPLRRAVTWWRRL